MVKVVFINESQFRNNELEEMHEVLGFLGYDLELTDVSRADIIIDKRSAGWVTLKNALSSITIMHPREMVEYYKWQKAVTLDKPVYDMYIGIDDIECST